MSPEPIAWIEGLKALSVGVSAILLGLLLVTMAPIVFVTFIDQLGDHRVRARVGSRPRPHPYR
ncbi:MAG: hypothetical protein ACXWUG_00770 [Polyangiales bacterium]